MDLIDIDFIRAHPDDIPRPWLPVIIKNPHTGKSQCVLGLIDTGADECAIPAGYAPLLGHDLQSGIPKSINTGNGVTTAYAHTLCFEINGIHIDNVMIDFLPNLNVVLEMIGTYTKNIKKMLLVNGSREAASSAFNSIEQYYSKNKKSLNLNREITLFNEGFSQLIMGDYLERWLSG